MKDDQSPKPQRSRNATNHTTDARATAQRAKLDAQTEAIPQEMPISASAGTPKRKKERPHPLPNRRANMPIERTIGDYVLDHEGGNRSLYSP